MTKLKNAVSWKILLLYSVLFFVVWSLFEWYLKPHISSEIIKTGLIKNLLWTLPALLLIYHFSDKLWLSYKEMFTNKVHWLKYSFIFLIFTVYILIGSTLDKGQLAFSSGFSFQTVIVLLFVGITEESVFRGWLLNATLKKLPKWWAILLNAILFLLIHFPSWIYSGAFVQNMLSLNFLVVPILSTLFSWTFIKSRSFVVPIALHMYWDFLMFLFW